MSCFIVPMVQAIATSALRKHYETSVRNGESSSLWKEHLPSLEKMLWGGTFMLLVDHAINAELTMSLREMLTVGVPMSVVVTAVWAVSLYVMCKREHADYSVRCLKGRMLKE